MEAAWTLSALVILGLAGGFALSALNASRPFALLMAPMCGLLVLPPLTTLLYSTGRLSFGQAAILALAVAVGATLMAAVRIDWKHRRVAAPLALLAVVCALSAFGSAASAIQNGAPAVLYTDGTDHAGYAHLADWLLHHTARQHPTASPDDPYQSWPHVMFSIDPRLSAFVVVALAALLRRTSGLFAYDLACAVVLAAGILAAVAVFAKSRKTASLLAAALFLCVWFEYGRAGFFGKLAGYSGALFLVGILLTTERWTAKAASTLAVLTIGAATIHSAHATTLFVAVAGGAFIVARLLLERRTFHENEQLIFVLALSVAVALASNGMFGRILGITAGAPVTESWRWVLPRLFEVQTPTRDFLPWPARWLEIGALIAMVLQCALIGLAIHRRDARATALTGGPALMAAGLFLLDQKWVVHQMTGCIVPFSACALAGWLDEDARAHRSFVVIVAVLSISFLGLRLPRAAVSFERYVARPIPTEQYRASDIAALAALIGPRTVLVDTANTQPALVVLLEFRRRVANIQWSPRAWNAILAYRPWPAPVYAAAPDFWLGGVEDAAPEGQLVFQGTRHRLIKLK